MAGTRKTSDEFVGATGDYATYTNDVDKPYAQPKDKPVKAKGGLEVKNPPEPSEFYAKPQAEVAKPKPKADAPKAPAK